MPSDEDDIASLLNVVQRKEESPYRIMILEGKVGDEPMYYRSFACWYTNEPVYRLYQVDKMSLDPLEIHRKILGYRLSDSDVSRHRAHIAENYQQSPDLLWQLACTMCAGKNLPIAFVGFGLTKAGNEPKVLFWAAEPVPADELLLGFQTELAM